MLLYTPQRHGHFLSLSFGFVSDELTASSGAYRASLAQGEPLSSGVGPRGPHRADGVVVGGTDVGAKKVGGCLSIAPHAGHGAAAGCGVQQTQIRQVSDWHSPAWHKAPTLSRSAIRKAAAQIVRACCCQPRRQVANEHRPT